MTMTGKRKAGRSEKIVEIGIGGLDELSSRALEVWRAAEQGEAVKPARERLLFEDLQTLLKALTPRRWALLRNLRGLGPSSVRALAKAESRDYKTVHTDVRELERLGLIARGADGRVLVPWDRVLVDLDLAA